MLRDDHNARNGDFSGLECPTCHALGQFRHHGSYRRWLVSDEGEARRESLVEVKRLRCKSCLTVHSLVPRELPTRSPNSAGLCEEIARDHAERTLTVSQLCEKYGLSVRTLYRILHRLE